MKRINYIVLIVLAASLGLVACSESYPSVNYQYESVPTNAETPGEDRSVPLMVFVDRQSFFSLSSTRGAGHFDPIEITSPEDEKDKFRNTHFYLYAFRDPKFTSSTYDNPLLHDLPDLTYTMLATTGGKIDNENLNCLVDGYNYYEGYKTKLDDAGGMILPVKPYVFYYPEYQDVGFNFFAYSIDDAMSADMTEPKATRTKESIYYNLAIDGTQDIMCGYAPDITESVFNVGNGRYGNMKLTETEKKRILDIGKYCTYAGHRNIHPYIDIHHQLTRLEFVAYPAEEEANYVTIDEIIVYAPNTGKLVVADRDPSNIGYTPDVVTDQSQMYPFKLHEGPQKDDNGQWKCSPMRTNFYRTNEWNDSYIGTPIDKHGDPVRIGGEGSCIMLPEQEEFLSKLVATYTNPKEPTNPQRFESVYRLKPIENDDNKVSDGVYKFRSGHYYTIAVAVYGLKEIKVFSEIDKWNQGATVVIDPDNPVGGEKY